MSPLDQVPSLGWWHDNNLSIRVGVYWNARLGLSVIFPLPWCLTRLLFPDWTGFQVLGAVPGRSNFWTFGLLYWFDSTSWHLLHNRPPLAYRLIVFGSDYANAPVETDWPISGLEFLFSGNTLVSSNRLLHSTRHTLLLSRHFFTTLLSVIITVWQHQHNSRWFPINRTRDLVVWKILQSLSKINPYHIQSCRRRRQDRNHYYYYYY